MAEGFELVRTIRQHLRAGAALLDQGKLDDALREVEAALALDAQSGPALALRDRIQSARAGSRAFVARAETDDRTSKSFVPHGVNAASWRGFEQRITERRFRALLETINTSIVTGDAVAARLALEEARELRPEAPELAEFEARVAAVPVLPPAEPAFTSRIWMRAMGAAALFLVGVSLLLGLEWLRPEVAAVPVELAAPEAPASAPVPDPAAPATDLAPVPVAASPADDDGSVAAVITPPEPLLQPRGTTGAATESATAQAETPRIETPRPATPPAPPVAPPVRTDIASRAVATREIAAPAATRTAVRQTEEDDQPVRARGEVADDFVASRPVASAALPGAGRPMPPARVPDTVVAAEGPRAEAADTVVPAAAVRPPADQGRVEEVLRRYASAYGALDARAARAVWPSVDEKALARAFSDLSSQSVSFDDCDIDIRGAVANASCRGQASYVGKVGSREPRSEARLWRFELRRDGEEWMIQSAEARRQSAAAYQDR